MLRTSRVSAQRVANATQCHVIPRPVPNPTLVHHGLVPSARWHVVTTEPPQKAVADIYAGSQPIARRITQTLANLLGEQLGMLDNAHMPASLKAHPRSTVAPTASFASNPSRSRRARSRRAYHRLHSSRKSRRAGAKLRRRHKPSGFPRAAYYSAQHRERLKARGYHGPNPKGRIQTRTDYHEGVSRLFRGTGIVLEVEGKWNRGQLVKLWLAGASTRRGGYPLTREAAQILLRPRLGLVRRTANPKGRIVGRIRSIRMGDRVRSARGGAEAGLVVKVHGAIATVAWNHGRFTDEPIGNLIKGARTPKPKANPKGRKRSPSSSLIGPGTSRSTRSGGLRLRLFREPVPEIVKRAIRQTVVNIGQFSRDARGKAELRDLERYVRAGFLEKGKGGPFQKIKTVYAVPGYPFDQQREFAINEMMRLADVPSTISRGRNPIGRNIDKRSVRTIVRGGKRILVGCPTGQYRPRARTARKCATGMRRLNPRATSAIARAAHTFRNWQDRGPLALRKKTMRAPRPLKGAAAELGKLVGVVYRSDKFDGKTKDYEHDFSKPLPSLVTDPDAKGLHIVGGRYKITSDGIVH